MHHCPEVMCGAGPARAFAWTEHFSMKSRKAVKIIHMHCLPQDVPG